MSRYFVTILSLFAALSVEVRANTIAQWNFNSVVPDTNTSTGTLAPSTGAGSASTVLTTSAFIGGDTNSDPSSITDNSSWNPTGWPTSTGVNKGSGIQFLVDATGYTNLMVSWTERHSPTASRYMRLQYTTDGTTWTDSASSSTVSAANSFVPLSVDLSSVAATANNNKFGVRIVSEWQNTATGSGSNSFVATTATNTYGGAGTVRFEAVTFTGDVIAGGNTPPTIANIGSQFTHIGTPTAPISITVGDAETPNSLTLTGASSDTTLVPNGNYSFTGTGSNPRTVTITPAPGLTGTATITITVTDGGGLTNSANFLLTVYPANTPPTISSIPRGNAVTGGATTAIPFTVGDLETPNSLTLSASSANTALVPNGNITFGGSGTNRTVTVTSAAGQSGVAPITVTVNDGTNTANTTFPVMVVPSATVLFYDPFNYADGALTTNSGFLWANNSGTAGTLTVASGQITVSSAKTEDVISPLVGGTNTAAVVYTSYKVNFSSAPTAAGGYFQHLSGGGSVFRCKVFSFATNGNFRLGISDSASAVSSFWPTDLTLNTTYTVVTRFDTNSGICTLWIDPTAETDASVSGSDNGTGAPITSVSFRQDTGIGTMTVDDLRVGQSFADVLVSSIPSVPLSVALSGGNVQIAWTTSGTSTSVLQSNLNLSTTNWTTVSQTPTVVGSSNVVTITAPTGKTFYRLKM